MVGRYGTAVLDEAAPEGLEGRILELLGGPRPMSAATPSSEETGVWIDPDDLPAPTMAHVADTGVWVEPDDLCADLGASTTVPLSGQLPVPADRFPEPEPGSGRRRRRAVGGAQSTLLGETPATPQGLDAPPPPPQGPRAHGGPVPRGAARQAPSTAGSPLAAPTELLAAGDPGATTGQGVTGAFVPPPAGGPQVMAVMCAAGHPNPPDSPACHSCTAVLTGEMRMVPRPVLAVLVLASGEAIPVRGDIVVGRAPQAQPGGEPGAMLLPVSSPTHLVSRSHLSLTTAGWNVLARDLGSNNGTVLVRPGQIPVLLATALPTPLYVGDLLDIGDGVTLRVEPPL